jgi:hypothetical protein
MSSLADLKPLLVTLLCAAGVCLGGGTLLAWLVLKAINTEPCDGGAWPDWGELRYQAKLERQLNRR